MTIDGEAGERVFPLWAKIFERLVLVGVGLHRVMLDTILLDLAGYFRYQLSFRRT